MSSHHQSLHAAGAWNQQRHVTVDNSAQDMSLDPPQVKSKNESSSEQSHPYVLPPQTQVQMPTQHRTPRERYHIEGGEVWTGVIPRAVSHDQSDETMEEMGNDSEASSAQMTNSSSFYANFTSPTAANQSASLEVPPTSVDRTRHAPNVDVSPYSHGSTNTKEDSNKYDTDGTAYFSVGATFLDPNNGSPQETPAQFEIESSIAVSLSPSPVRNMIGSANDTTILTTSEERQEPINEKEVENNHPTNDSGVNEDRINSCRADEKLPQGLLEMSSDISESWAQDVSATNQNVFVLRGNARDPAEDAAFSAQRYHSSGESKLQGEGLGPSSTLQSDNLDSHSLIAARSLQADQMSLVQKEISSWRSNSILDSLEEASTGSEQPHSLQKKKEDGQISDADPLSQLQQSSKRDSALQESSISPAPYVEASSQSPRCHVEVAYDTVSVGEAGETTRNQDELERTESWANNSCSENSRSHSSSDSNKENGGQIEIETDAAALRQSLPSTVDPPVTPRKPELSLHHSNYVPNVTTSRQILASTKGDDIAAYIARIGVLEEELAASKRCIKEQRQHYEEQYAKLHNFTLPLQPQSPFDANTNQRLSPGTQQQRLIERNETLLKEVRFADQVCVELSEQNNMLAEKVRDKDRLIEELRIAQEELIQTSTNSHKETEALRMQLLQANEDKQGLERQLHAAYDKLDEASRTKRDTQAKHDSELVSLRQSINNQRDEEETKMREQLRSLKDELDMKIQVICSVSSERDAHKANYQSVQKEKQILAEKIDNLSSISDSTHRSLQQQLHQLNTERDDLMRQIKEMSNSHSNYKDLLREREVLSKKATSLAGDVDRTKQLLESTREELDIAKNDLERVRMESKQSIRKLKEADRKLMEMQDLKEQQEQEIALAQHQASNWKEKVKQLKGNSSAEVTTEPKRVPSAQKDESNEIFLKAQSLENDFFRDEAKFNAQVESYLENMDVVLASLVGHVFNGSDEPKPSICTAPVNPSLLSHYISSSSRSMNGELLSPQVIQILQLLSTFSQQNLEVLAKEVGRRVSEQSSRLHRLQRCINHIQSSIVFESESDVSEKGSVISEGQDMLDATFAAVTSIPDQKVELMEEARPCEQEGRYVAQGGGDIQRSPARDTILDLSRIDVVNSPYHSSDLTSPFSFESEMDTDKNDNDIFSSKGQEQGLVKKAARVERIQQATTDDPLGPGSHGVRALIKLVKNLKEEFSSHRLATIAFVESQQSALQHFVKHSSTLAAREGLLVEEKKALTSNLLKEQAALSDCQDEIQKRTSELEASERAKTRLQTENRDFRKEIATLQEYISDMEYRLIGNGRGTSPQVKLGVRTNSFQDRLEASLNEQCSSGSTNEIKMLRSELSNVIQSKEFYQREVDRLSDELHQTKESQEKLQISFVRCNDKLAAANEVTEEYHQLNAKLSAATAREEKLQNQVILLEQQVQEHEGLRAAYAECNDKLAQTLDKISILETEKDKVDKLVHSTKHKDCELSLVRQNEKELRAKVERLDREAEKSAYPGGEEARQRKEELQQAQDQLKIAIRDRDNLESKLQKLQLSFANCNNKLIEATEKASNNDERLRSLENMRKETEGELQKKNLALKEAHSEADDLRAQIADIQSKTDSALVEIKCLLSEKAELAANLHDLKASYALANNKLGETLEVVKSQEVTIAELARQKEDVLQAGADYEKRLQESVDRAEREIESLRTSFIESNDKLTEAREKAAADELKINEMESTQLELETCLLEKDSAMQEMQEETTALQKKISDLKEAKNQNLSEIQRLKKALEGSRCELESLKVSYADCNNKLVEALETIEANDGVAKRLQAKLDDARDESAALRTENANLDMAKERLETEFELIQEALGESEKELQELKMCYEECNDKLEGASEAAESGRQFFTELEVAKQTSKRLSKEKEILEADLKSSRKDVDSLTEKLAAAEKAATERHEEWAREQKMMRDSIETTSQQLQEITTTLGNDLNDAQVKIVCMHEQLEQAATEKETFQEENDFLRSSKDDLESRLKTLQLSYAACNDKLAELLDEKTRTESLVKDLQKACEAAESLTDITERRLSDCQIELEETTNERDDLLCETKDLQNQLSRASEDLRKYKEETETGYSETTQIVANLEREKEEALHTAEMKLSKFATEIHALRREISVSISLMNDNKQEDSFVSRQGSLDTDEELASLKVKVSSLCESVTILVDKLEISNTHSQRLNNEVARLRAAENELTAFLQDEKVVSEELASQLKEARAQAEFSSSKVNRLIGALEDARASETDERRRALWVETARQEAQLHYETELGLKAESTDEMMAKILESESRIMELSSNLVKRDTELTTCKDRLLKAIEDSKVKDQNLSELQAQKDIWENRCFKLREYMRKLTTKCEEWEMSYAQQTKVLEILHSQHEKMKVKRAEIARKYADLVNDLKAQDEIHGEARDQLVSDLQSVRSVQDQLEDELNQIAIELQNVSWSS